MMSSVARSRSGFHAGSFLVGILALASASALIPLVILPLAWKEQAIFGAALIVIGLFLNATSRSLTVTMLLMTFSVFSTLRYGYWRVIQTWDGITSAGHIHRWDNIFVLLLLAAEFFAFSTLILGYFQTLRPLKRPPLPLAGNPSSWPTVDVLVPTYNEPLHVVRGTVMAAMAIEYPRNKMRVLLLDDGKREEFREFAAQVGVEYVTRGNNAHAKAGNINHALEKTTGEYIAIFDCDHVPARSFLQMTLGWFQRDHNLALVQTPHHFYSPDPFERNLGQFRRVPNEGELFHRLVQDGNDLWNASFFCGSCAVMRRSALEEIGGIAVETVTEDAHTALRLQRNGWNTAYINIPLAAGLATESLAAHIGQRIRWARGMTQILRVENPLFASGLTLSQRLCYFNATTHFLFAIPRLIFLLVPLVYLVFGKVNIYGYTWAILAYAFPHLVLSNLTNSRIQGRHRYSFWNEIYEVVLAPYILFPTLLALINPRLGKFNVTSKGGILRRSYFDKRIALPYLLLLAFNITGLVMAERRYMADPVHRDTIIMNGAWCAYSTMILLVAASVAWERRQLRDGACLRAKVPATLKLTSDQGINGNTLLISRSSVTLKVDTSLELARGMSIMLVLGDRRSQCEVPALVAHSAGRRQHLFLPDLTDEQVRQIERLAYSRQRGSRSLLDFQHNDRPLRSLAQIFLLAIRGVVIVPLGLFVPAPSTEVDPIPSSRKSWAASILVPFLLAGTMLLPRPVRAADAGDLAATSKVQTDGIQPADFHDEFQLSASATARALTLQKSGASLNWFFGEPVTKVTTHATLKLQYAALDLRANEARLELTLNGAVVGSIALVSGSTQQAEISLPTDLLTNDNTLSIELQGTCSSCNAKRGPWVTLDPRSTVSITGTRLPLANDLSLIPLPFFDPSGERSWSLPVVFANSPDSITLESAAIVASHFGVLSDVRGVHFPVTVGEFPNGNALVLALRNAKILSGLSLPSAHGPLLAMRDNPHDPYGKLLIVTGDTPDELLQAALTLATATWFPHVNSQREHSVQGPSLQAYSAPRWLQSDGPSAIGTYTTEEHLKLHGTGSLDLYFRLPPDLFLRARQSVPLLLKYEYGGAPEGTNPALHVRVNGQDIDTIQLKPTSTSVRQSEMVRIPTGSLLPFTNTLTVDFYFQGTTPASAHPTFAVERDSSLDLHGLPHAVLLPRLELFADAGYPFTEWPDLGRTAVILPGAPTPTDYETFLDMAGFFGAQTGALAAQLTVADADHLDQVRDKDLVLIGTQTSQSLFSQWAGAMPLSLSGTSMQVNEAPQSTLLMHPEWPFRSYDGNRLRRLISGDSDQDLLVESFVSPLRDDREVVAIVPGDAQAIDAVRALFTPSEREGPVYGGVAVSREGRFESFLVGTQAYHAGELDRYQYATVLLIEDYWLIPFLVIAFALIIVAWVRWSTERIAAERLAMRET
ncbi:MAG TPA: UDP-forming cellulose synthase catalytic subunit [Terracidiphilus sp.]|jgi:cellulose synthase (UDP-forming)